MTSSQLQWGWLTVHPDDDAEEKQEEIEKEEVEEERVDDQPSDPKPPVELEPVKPDVSGSPEGSLPAPLTESTCGEAGESEKREQEGEEGEESPEEKSDQESDTGESGTQEEVCAELRICACACVRILRDESTS